MSLGTSRRASDAGETLVELLVTIAILAIAFTGILAGVGTALIASDVHRKAATSETLVRNVGEMLVDRAVPYVPCAKSTSYSITGVTIPSGYNASVASVDLWDGKSPAGYVPTLSTCPEADAGVQRLTVLVAASGVHAESETVQVVKRAP